MSREMIISEKNKTQLVVSPKQPTLNYKEYTKSVHPSNGSVLANSIEIIESKLLFSLIQSNLIEKLYWYCNRYPPKNVSDSFFFNIDDVTIDNQLIDPKYMIHILDIDI